MCPKSLAVDRRQFSSPFRIPFVAQQGLRARRNVHQWIVDLVTRAIGKLLKGEKLFGFQSLGEVLFQ